MKTNIRLITALAASLTMLGVNIVPAAAAPGQSLGVTATMSSFYDDNFIQYSDNQIADFDAGSHPQRYSIESTGDAILRPSLALLWELDQGHGRRHALRARADGDFHARNGTADYRAASVRWTEAFSRAQHISVGYYRADDFYLRQLRDEDLPLALGDSRYRRAQFDLQIASATWRQTVGRGATLGASYRYEDRRYVPEFRERDSGTQQGELSLGWDRLPRRANLEFEGGYVSSDARGTDGDEVGGIVDDDDVSYHGLVAGANGRMELMRQGSWRVGGDLSYGLETRTYDSDLPTDRYHFGRKDILNVVEVGARLGYRPHWSLRGFYRLEDNHADLGTSAPPTSDSGSYRVNQVGLAIEWTADVWRQAPQDTEE